MQPWPLTSLVISCGDRIKATSPELSVWHSCFCEKLDGVHARQALSGSAGATGTCLWLRRAHWQRPISPQANCWMCWRDWAGKSFHLIMPSAGNSYLHLECAANSTVGDHCQCMKGRHEACCETCSKEDTDAPPSTGAGLPDSSEPVLPAHAPVMSMAGMPIHAGTGVKPRHAQRRLLLLLRHHLTWTQMHLLHHSINIATVMSLWHSCVTMPYMRPIS